MELSRKNVARCGIDLLQADANTLLRNPALYVTNNNLGYILAVSADLTGHCRRRCCRDNGGCKCQCHPVHAFMRAMAVCARR